MFGNEYGNFQQYHCRKTLTRQEEWKTQCEQNLEYLRVTYSELFRRANSRLRALGEQIS